MLDIHIATSLDDATRSERLHGIPLEEHALLFGDIEFLHGHPIIQGMEDYCSDTHISTGNVQRLANEIKSLKSKLANDSLKLRMLDKLGDACKRAGELQQSIFLFAD